LHARSLRILALKLAETAHGMVSSMAARIILPRLCITEIAALGIKESADAGFFAAACRVIPAVVNNSD
jgi:hypothetical protein